MVLETHHLSNEGSVKWFLHDIETIERDEFGVLKKLKNHSSTNFDAIQIVVSSADQLDWRFFDSQKFEISEIENLVRIFVKNHASIPYISGTTIRTQDPIGCLEGDTEDTATKNKVKCKLAYWGNGLVYYIEEENTDKFLYLLAVDEKTAELYNYPESKKDQSE